MKDWVKFLDVAAINERFIEAFRHDITKVVQSGQVLYGQQTQKFEEEFAEYCHTAHCVGVANGLDALWLTLLARRMGRKRRSHSTRAYFCCHCASSC